MALSKEERRTRKNAARNLRRATDPAYAKRQAEKSARYRAEHPDKARACQANHYQKNKVEVRAKEKARRAANPGPHRASSTAYRLGHKDEVSIFSKEYRAANAGRIKAQAAANYLANREAYLAKCAANYVANPAPAKARTKAWIAANPDKVRINHINRRAKKKNGAGKLSHGIADRLMVLQQGKCPVCCIDLRESGYHLDHIEALSKGGAHEDSNIQLLCPPCNQCKHVKHPIDFMQSRGFLL
ncbi:MAG: HNH endonuclease signature motif containing protein [Burkholderiales bacterium]